MPREAIHGEMPPGMELTGELLSGVAEEAVHKEVWKPAKNITQKSACQWWSLTSYWVMRGKCSNITSKTKKGGFGVERKWIDNWNTIQVSYSSNLSLSSFWLFLRHKKDNSIIKGKNLRKYYLSNIRYYYVSNTILFIKYSVGVSYHELFYICLTSSFSLCIFSNFFSLHILIWFAIVS